MSMVSLAGLPGKVKTLLDRLTETRATNLDDIDTTVSSRAPSTTALSTATWTSAKASYLRTSTVRSGKTGSANAAHAEWTTVGTITVANKTLCSITQNADPTQGSVQRMRISGTSVQVYQFDAFGFGTVTVYYSYVEFY
jgi:hypothetical protein